MPLSQSNTTTIPCIEFTGQLTKVTVHEPDAQLQRQVTRSKPTRTRSQVCGFSRRARSRMMTRMATIDFDKVHLSMVTLTYGKEFPKDSDVWKRDKHTMVKALRRRLPDIGIIWKLEPQKRGAPHYHLFLFFPKSHYPKMRDAFLCKDWLALRWAEITGDTSADHIAAGVRVERIRTVNGMMKYASKYIAKNIEHEEHAAMWQNVGHYWGTHNRDAIPEAETTRIEFTNAIEQTAALKVLNDAAADALYFKLSEQYAKDYAESGVEEPDCYFLARVDADAELDRIERDEPWIFENVRQRFMDQDEFLRRWRTQIALLEFQAIKKQIEALAG